MLKTPYTYFLLLLFSFSISCQNEPQEKKKTSGVYPAVSNGETVTGTNIAAKTNPLQKTVTQKLKTVEWTAVSEDAFVKFRPENRSDSKDLSFEYKTKVVNDTLFLQVEVSDEKVFLKQGKETSSDHIELWLADPNITSVLKENILPQQVFIEWRKSAWKTQPECRKVDEPFIKDLQKIMQVYKKDKYFTQFVFNKDHTWVLPKEKGVEIDYDYHYQTTSIGYNFYLSLPLDHKIDFAYPDITNLAFMIDVIDIDQIDSPRQESLISSSDQREYGQAALFNQMALKDSLSFKLDHKLWMQDGIAGGGMYRLKEGQYQFYVTESFLYSGLHGENRDILPGAFVPFEKKLLDKTSDIEVYHFNDELILEQGELMQHFPLDSLVSARGGFDMQVLFNQQQYLLLRVTGASRWPMGNTVCGSGFETNIVYLKLNNQLLPEWSQTVLVESCNQVATLDSEKGISEIKATRTEPINILFYDETIPTRLIFDPKQPKKGIKIEKTHT